MKDTDTHRASSAWLGRLLSFIVLGGLLCLPTPGRADGVTIITHGWNPSGVAPVWMASLRDAIATNFLGGALWTVLPGRSNLVGTGGVMALSDTNAASPTRFYRVGAGLP